MNPKTPVVFAVWQTKSLSLSHPLSLSICLSFCLFVYDEVRKVPKLVELTCPRGLCACWAATLVSTTNFLFDFQFGYWRQQEKTTTTTIARWRNSKQSSIERAPCSTVSLDSAVKCWRPAYDISLLSLKIVCTHLTPRIKWQEDFLHVCSKENQNHK